MKSTCDECGYEAETVRLIQSHKLRVHRGVKYPCDKCDYVTAYKSSHSYHMKSKHEKIRFQCDICTRKSTSVQTIPASQPF
jgi:KRAB domain-containing zinc finger protein